MTALVLSVSEVTAAMTKSLPPLLILQASGIAPTTGWTNAELAAAVYIVEPADGIWDFELLATPPQGLAAQVLTPIAASITTELPTWCRGVRVRAATNDIAQQLFEGKEPADAECLDVPVVSRARQAALAGFSSGDDPGDGWPAALTGTAALAGSKARKDLVFNRTKATSDMKVDDLIGRQVRVVPKGGVVTLDFNPNRVNFFLDEERRIESWRMF